MTTDFSATASALGYYYQIRYALLVLRVNGTEPLRENCNGFKNTNEIR